MAVEKAKESKRYFGADNCATEVRRGDKQSTRPGFVLLESISFGGLNRSKYFRVTLNVYSAWQKSQSISVAVIIYRMKKCQEMTFNGDC